MLSEPVALPGPGAVWSMWDGYLDQPAGLRLQAWLGRHDIPLTIAHASGHASVADLKRLAVAMRPDRIVEDDCL